MQIYAFFLVFTLVWELHSVVFRIYYYSMLKVHSMDFQWTIAGARNRD